MEEYNYNLFVGNIITAIFMIIACYFGTIKFHERQHGLSSNPINEFITVGFLEDSPTVIESKKQPSAPNQLKSKHKPKAKPVSDTKKTVVKEKIVRNENNFTPLQQDCHDALKSLKVTNKEAQYLVHTIFNTHDPKTIQDFLQLAFVRGK